MKTRTLVSAAALALLAGCQELPTDSLEPGAINLTIVSGNNQIGEVEQELARPLIAWITNPKGKSVKNVVVTFHVVQGGGSVFSGAAKSNDHGIVYEYWTLGPEGGVQRLEVRAVDPASGQKRVYATFTAIAIGIWGKDMEAVPVDPPLYRVRVIDEDGKPLPGFTVHFREAIFSIEEEWRVLASVRTDEDGLASFLWFPQHPDAVLNAFSELLENHPDVFWRQ